MDVTNLDIYLEQAPSGADYTARVTTEASGSVAPQVLTLTTDDGLLGGLPLRTALALDAPLPPAASPFAQALRQWQGGNPGRDTVELIGNGLYQAWPGGVRDLYNLVWGGLRTDRNKLLRIRLHFSTPDLGLLPWELTKVDDDLLCERRGRSLIRYPEFTDPAPRLGTPGPLKVLLWAAAGTEQELATVAGQIQAELGPAAQIEVERTGRTLDLFNRLQNGGYHVLHYVGQGRYDGEAQLAFQGAAALIWATADQLRPAVQDNPTLQLILLSAAAGEGASRAFVPLAFDLARFVPAIVAVPQPGSPASTAIFVEQFYRALGDNQPLDLCVTAGRQGVIAEFGARQVDWGAPAFFTRAMTDMVLGATARPMVDVGVGTPVPTPASTETVAGSCAWGLPRGTVTPDADEVDYLTRVSRRWGGWRDEQTAEYIPSAVAPLPLAYMPGELIRRGARNEGGASIQLWSMCDTSHELLASGRLLVLGRPGIGKTSLLKFLAHQYATLGDGKILPVMVSLRAWGVAPDQSATLLDYIKSFLITPISTNEYPRAEQLARNLDAYLASPQQQARLLFLLDDYNRLAQDDPVAYQSRLAHLREFADTHPAAYIVVVSRSLAYDGQLDGCDPPFKVVEVNTWGADQIREYLRRNYPDLLAVANDPRTLEYLLDLADIPEQIAQLVSLVRGGKVPQDGLFTKIQNTQALLTAYVQSLFDFSEATGQGATGLRGPVQAALSRLARRLAGDNKRGSYVQYPEALQYLADGQAAPAVDQLLRVAADATILDVTPRRGQVGFEGQALEDYFAGLAQAVVPPADAQTAPASPVAMVNALDPAHPDIDTTLAAARAMKSSGLAGHAI